MSRRWSPAGAMIAGSAVAVLLGASIGGAPAEASGAPNERLARQIKRMERVLDEVLRQSPFFLVYGVEYTRAIYLEEFGALFTFEASLVRGDPEWDIDLSFLRQLRVETEGGKVTIWRDGDEADEKKVLVLPRGHEERDEEVAEKRREGGEKQAERREKQAEDAAKRYAEGKEELIGALLDYGETLAPLRDDQWVAIAAFLSRSKFFDASGISRLLIKARMSDLRDSGRGRITESEMRSRVVVEEY
ncbi:MAG: hypothetical protein FJY75_03920 [Candidatus Eisenbacteria bacterium]|uniref:Uncharacterized protein n=1 Tax=Eiseniibacteriota bacterium TaxID=2212470 RepID=A0A938BQL8_UNCEI|nr:hypothetical protein [Candidatus Eisenbacteria bacterium]